jgi:hypothetical protein
VRGTCCGLLQRGRDDPLRRGGLRFEGRSEAADFRQRETDSRRWSGSYPTEVRAGTAEQGPTLRFRPTTIRAWLPRARTPPPLGRCGSCPRRLPAVTWSRLDAGTRRSWSPLGDTTLRTAQRRWAQRPASARWREQLPETRDSRRNGGQEMRQVWFDDTDAIS